MSESYAYVMNGVTKYYNDKKIVEGVSLSFYRGAKIGVLGVNGAGKSTILRIISGEDKDFTGEAWAGKDVKVGYLSQEPKLDEDKTVKENILKGVSEIISMLKEYEDISMRFAEEMTDDEMNDLLAKQAELQEKIDHVDGWEYERRLEVAMAALGCPSPDALVSNISGGERRRVALCILLLQEPDILLLDEPTNHLDAISVAWLENYLKKYKGSVIMVTHDRYFLDNVTGWILEIERGRAIPWQGNYSSWLAQKEKKLSQESKSEDARQKFLKQELEWINQNAKGQRKKSSARIHAYEELLAKERDVQPNVAQIVIPEGPRLGTSVLELKEISKKYGDKILFSNLSFAVPRGAIVGVIGHNGMGKTTLLRIITGEEQPDSGSVCIGDTVLMSYIDQFRTLDDSKNVWEEISDGQEDIPVGRSGGSIKSRAYCSAFNFKGSDQQKLVGTLSGGQRGRVHLAKMLRSGGNLLFLDEPTNDLDVDTARSLEEAICNFTGSAFIVSHDRWFLDRTVTHILAFEGDGHVEWFEGNYQDYEEDYKRRYGDAPGVPKKFKKFSTD